MNAQIPLESGGYIELSPEVTSEEEIAEWESTFKDYGIAVASADEKDRAKAYEEAKAEYVAEVIREYKEAVARAIIREFFGGTPERQEQLYVDIYLESIGNPED